MRFGALGKSGFALGLIAASALILPQGHAAATNQGSTSGDNTVACAVDWHAQTVMDIDLKNDDPNYPNLMTDWHPPQNPIDSYSNGGYIYEVRPEYGDPGIFEITHWYSNTASPSVAGTVANWRIPIATNYSISNPKLVVQLPSYGGTYTATISGATDNAYMQRWGAPYSYYTWSSHLITGTSDANGKWTIDLSNFGPMSAAVVTLTQTVPVDTNLTDQFLPEAWLTGTYTNGATSSCGDLPPTPEPPTEGACQQVLLGRAVRGFEEGDISIRDKRNPGGEVNADGWATTFRLYGATKNALEDVVFTATATQGLTFGTVDAAVSSPGGGFLAHINNPDRYPETASGFGTPTLSADGKVITLTIDSMPVRSSFSFNATFTATDPAQARVIDFTMVGTLVGCTQPPNKVETSEWTDGAVDCAAGTVTQTRTVTTTPYVWEPDSATFVLGSPTVATETRTRPMTDAEKLACVPPTIPTIPTSSTTTTTTAATTTTVDSSRSRNTGRRK